MLLWVEESTIGNINTSSRSTCLAKSKRYGLHVIDAQTMNENDYRTRDVSPDACCMYLGATNQDFQPCYPRFRSFEWKKNYLVEPPFQRKKIRLPTRECGRWKLSRSQFRMAQSEGMTYWFVLWCKTKQMNVEMRWRDLLNGSPVQIRQMEDRSIKLHMFLEWQILN